MSDILLRLRDVSLSYRIDGRPVPVLKSANFSVRRGEMAAILGPSGSGKSTLLYVLGCMLRPSGGTFEIDGRDVAQINNVELAEIRCRSIGFVFQQFHLLARADLVENCMLAARYLPNDPRTPEELRAKAETLLRSLGLGEHLGHRPNQLSGGQQQRAAIARALMNDPDLILADEPTGNLDSKSTAVILSELERIHSQGRTVVMITHDREVAARCGRVVTIHDGVLDAEAAPLSSDTPPTKTSARKKMARALLAASLISWPNLLKHFAAARDNLWRNRTRSALTMLGVTIGIAAVLSTITLGGFVRGKILDSYESLGVNKLVVRAWPRWNLQARDIRGLMYEGLSLQNDVRPLIRLFPEIKLLSPVIQENPNSVEYGGHRLQQSQVMGVTPEYFEITNRTIEIGRPLSVFHQKNRSRVCVIGSEVASRLFGHGTPLQKVLQINGQADTHYSCLVIGVLKRQTSNNEYASPNAQILTPLSFLSAMTAKFFSKPMELDIQMAPSASAEELGTKIKNFIELKYGRSVDAHVDNDELLVAQMRKFLTLFGLLLAGVAFMSLTVGGIGIANMMLASVAERFKEIGLRKALGASDHEIRTQFLAESLVLCVIAGVAGVVVGVAAYEVLIYLASKLSVKVQFEWVVSWPAMALSVISILAVGLASGLAPALRAERLEVVEALRSE